MFQWPATQIMDNIVELHHDIFSVMLIIVTVVFYMLWEIIYSYNEHNSKTHRNFEFTHHTFLETVWTLIPMFVLLLIIVPSFVLLYNVDELYYETELTVKVIGRQWYWTYEYLCTCDFSTEGEGHVVKLDSYLLSGTSLSQYAAGGFRLLEVDFRPVMPFLTIINVLVTSSDVLHSWAVPSFGVKMDACPGRLNKLGLFIKRTGFFFGQCSEICGINHGFMPIAITVSPYRFFHEWLLNTH